MTLPNKKSKKPPISNAVQLDAENPIPLQYGSGAFTHFNGGMYVPFLGSDDNFFNTLFEASILSTTHNACVNTKRNYCVGNGLINTDKAQDTMFEKFKKEVLISVNNKNQSLNKICSKAFGNHFRMGNTFIELVRGAVGGKKFVKAYVHIPQECRLSFPNAEDICENVYISKRFNKLAKGVFTLTGKETDIKILPIYNAREPKKSWKMDENKLVERTVIHIKNDIEGYDYYGVPSAIGSLQQQVIEGDSARYNIDNLDNNMNPSGMLVLQGSLTQAESNKIGLRIIKQHTGKGKRGRVVVVSSESGIENSNFFQYNTQKDGSYIELDRRVEEKIITANEWDALLAGISSTGLGKGNSFLLSLFAIKNATVIKPAQNLIIDEFLTPFIKILDEHTGTKYSDIKLGLESSIPLSLLISDTTMDAWTIDEVRKLAGLEPCADTKKGEMLLGELKKSNNPQATV